MTSVMSFDDWLRCSSTLLNTNTLLDCCLIVSVSGSVSCLYFPIQIFQQ